jgi:carbamoylphosphate synthase large subunit
MRRNILISAGGTATAWHLANLVKSEFKEYFELYMCDINPSYLVPASTLSDKFIQVPPIHSVGYKQTMINLFKEYNIDIFVPLIDFDVYEFPCDDPMLKEIGVFSTGVNHSSCEKLRNKKVLSYYLQENKINVPNLYNTLVEIEEAKADEFLIKPISGFGSRGIKKISKRESREYIGNEDVLLQEICQGPEVTVEVFNSKGVIKSISRERIEVKNGVCTKTKLWFDLELHEIAVKLCNILKLPIAFCFQVMKNSVGEWVVIDVNPRLGAGTALASACGWSLASAALVEWGKLEMDASKYLNSISGEKFVTRVYKEIIMN